MDPRPTRRRSAALKKPPDLELLYIQGTLGHYDAQDSREVGDAVDIFHSASSAVTASDWV